MRLRLEIIGAEVTSRSLREIGGRLREPPRALFEALAQEWKALFRANISQTRLGPFEPLSPVTLEHRETTGYRPSPILLRSGSLQNSIDLLDVGPTHVEVGVRDSTGRSQLLQFGGRTSPRSRYPDRPVPARPFIALSDEDVETSLEAFVEQLFEEPA